MPEARYLPSETRRGPSTAYGTTAVFSGWPGQCSSPGCSCWRRRNWPGGFVALAWEKTYTLLGSCRRHGLNPFDYLKDLSTRLSAAKITQIKEFTQAAWAKAKANEKVVAQAT
jgi:hypothetical protein